MANQDSIVRPSIGKQIKLFAEILSAFNGGFESGPNAAMPTGWAEDAYVGTFGGFLGSNTDTPRTGAFCAKANIVGPSDYKYVKAIGFSDHMALALTHTDLTTGFPCIPGYKYMMELYAKKSAAAALTVFVAPEFRWYGSAGLITHTPTTQTKATTPSAWERAYVIDYAPKTATRMNGCIKFKGNNSDTDYPLVDDVKMWVPLGICQEIEFEHDNQVVPIKEWGNVDPVENKEGSNVYSASFKNFYLGLYGYYLSKRLANGKLPEFTLRIVIEQGTERRVINLLRCKLGSYKWNAARLEAVGESGKINYIGESRESGGEF